MKPTFLALMKLTKFSAKSYLLSTVIFFNLFFPTIVAAQTSPYPPSSLIESITFDFNTDFRRGVGADQWPLTWADDGHMYGLWGDGQGWDQKFCGVGVGKKCLMGLTRIAGHPSSGISGADIWGERKKDRKPSGFIADRNKKMYLFWATKDDKWKTSTGGISTNNGRSWNFNLPKVFDLNKDGAVVVGIAQFGPGYTRVPSSLDSSYFYVYLGRQMHAPALRNKGQKVYMGRVKKADIFKRSAYTYFNGFNSSGDPIWSANWSKKKPVFQDPNGMEFHVMVTYNAGLKRYIYAKGHNLRDLGIFEGPNPWGPWKTVYYKRFKDSHWKFTYQFPPKWMSNDGLTMWMAWSGWPQHDAVTFTKATLKLKEPKVDKTPPAKPKGLKVK